MADTATDDHKVLQRGRRKDGSERKPLRVRAGFTPQEEVQRYQAPGRRRMQAGNDSTDRQKAKPAEKETKQDKHEDEIQIKPVTPTVPEKSNEELHAAKQAELNSALKRTKKKLRQIEDLKSKVDSGAITPNEDQERKLSQYDTVQEEVDCILLKLNGLTL